MRLQIRGTSDFETPNLRRVRLRDHQQHELDIDVDGARSTAYDVWSMRRHASRSWEGRSRGSFGIGRLGRGSYAARSRLRYLNDTPFVAGGGSPRCSTPSSSFDRSVRSQPGGGPSVSAVGARGGTAPVPLTQVG